MTQHMIGCEFHGEQPAVMVRFWRHRLPGEPESEGVDVPQCQACEAEAQEEIEAAEAALRARGVLPS